MSNPSFLIQADLKASGKDARGLKEDSVLNQIPYFHVAKLGSIPPCIMHDVYQGKC